MAKDKHDFEKYPPGMAKDETDVNIRAYFALMDEAKLAQYDPKWSDEEVVAWDGNFKNDGSLLLICSEPLNGPSLPLTSTMSPTAGIIAVSLADR